MVGELSTLSEILQLTKKIDEFMLKFGGLVSAHDVDIKNCKEEKDIIKKTLYNDKNGMVSRMKGVETILKGKQYSSSRIISILTVFFMGGLFIMWIIKTVSEKVSG